MISIVGKKYDIRRTQNIDSSRRAQGTDRLNVVENDIENDIENVLDEKYKKLSERQRLIVQRMRLTATRNVIENDIENVVDNVVDNVVENNVTLAAYFNVTERTIQRDLKVLQEEGFLRHEGPDHGGRYVLLYS